MFLIKRRFLTYFLCKIRYVFSETRPRPPCDPPRPPRPKSWGRDPQPPRIDAPVPSVCPSVRPTTVNIFSAMHYGRCCTVWRPVTTTAVHALHLVYNGRSKYRFYVITR